jgi:hypothetical protein
MGKGKSIYMEIYHIIIQMTTFSIKNFMIYKTLILTLCVFYPKLQIYYVSIMISDITPYKQHLIWIQAVYYTANISKLLSENV